MQLDSLPKAVISFGACVSTDGNTIFIAGGSEGEAKKPTNECYAYNISDNSWRRMPSLNQPRLSCSIVQNNNKLYCFGGQDLDHHGRHNTLASIEVLDL